MLSEIAQKIGFNDFLLLSKGELKEEGKARQFILANTIEAFIGSLYLDRKMDASRKFIEENVLSELPRVLEQHLYRDAKSLFQEKAQEKVGVTPSYKVLREWGPDHAKHFVIGVYLGNELVAEGEGSAKQEGEEEAARLALEIKNW
jgi:ribonuclease-3